MRSIDHLRPAGKPAPPRPSRLTASTSWADLLGGHRQRLAQSFVPARGEVALEGVGVLVTEARGQDTGRFADRHHVPPVAFAAAATRSALMVASSTREPSLAADPDEGAVPGDVVGQPTGAQVVDQAVEGLGGHVAHEPVVHRQARGPAAVGDALGLLEGEHPVGGGGPGADPQGVLHVLEKLVRAAQHAGDVGAHRDHVGTDGLGAQHLVERGRAQDLGRRQPHQSRRSRRWPRAAASRPAPAPDGRWG